MIFDFDGTLADSFEIQKLALQTLAQRHNWPLISDEEFAELREKSLKDILKSRRIPLWRVPFLMQEGRKIIAEQWGSVQIFPGIQDMLLELRTEGYELGILTSNTREVVEIVLKNAGIRSYFFLIVAEPNLWGKDKRLKQLISVHNWNPQRVWYVGDEVRDLEAAQKAGTRHIGVSWGLNSANALALTKSPVVNSPKELIHWIQQSQ